jgi:DNA repair exonuclease SbcCD ATPase subunit
MMKKQILCLAIILLAGLHSFAQDIKEGTTELNKVSQPCIIASYAMSYDVVEGALLKKMSDAKYSKPSKTKDGFKMYKGINIPDIMNATLDYYIKIEDKKPNATLYMLISRGYDNFLKRESADSVAIENAKLYLNKFMTDLMSFQLNKDIVAQNGAIKDVEKKMKNAAKDEESLTKDKSKVESKISGNEIEIQALKVDMEAQQAALETVKQETATVDQMEALKKKVTKQEDASKKATKKYEKALESAGSYKDELQKTESKLNDNATEQLKIKSELEEANKKLEELKTQLANLK